MICTLLVTQFRGKIETQIAVVINNFQSGVVIELFFMLSQKSPLSEYHDFCFVLIYLHFHLLAACFKTV